MKTLAEIAMKYRSEVDPEISQYPKLLIEIQEELGVKNDLREEITQELKKFLAKDPLGNTNIYSFKKKEWNELMDDLASL